MGPIRQRKPGFVEMVDPREVDAAPVSEGWVHEIKWDGYRAQAHLEGGKSQVFTRRGNDWTAKFGPISRAVAGLKARTAILDGEVVAVDSSGSGDFHELRRQLGRPSPQLIYQVFDLLWLNGEDLRPLPYIERKAGLRHLLAGAGERLAYVPGIETAGRQVLKGVCGLRLEGIVSKRVDSPYRPGRSHDWLKIKCKVTETFAVVGFSRDNNDRIDGLYLGRAEDGRFRYAGQVDNGIGDEELAELERRLRPLVTSGAPLIEKPKGKSAAKWTTPSVLVEVEYPNKASDGRLRHPRFKGFRDDLAAKATQPRRSRRR
jgi:bifunctional non-homologous end joining protein LigD